MENTIAIPGMFLFRARLAWLSLNTRVAQVCRQAQIWISAAALWGLMVVFAGPGAIDGGTLMGAFALSLCVLTPLGQTLNARPAPSLSVEKRARFNAPLAHGLPTLRRSI